MFVLGMYVACEFSNDYIYHQESQLRAFAANRNSAKINSVKSRG